MCVNRTEILIAWRYLKARRHDRFISLTGWLAVVGMVLGVATLVLVTSLMNGIQHEMREQFLGIGGHITLTAPSGALTDYDDLVKYLHSFPEVAQVLPKIEKQAMLNANGVARGAQIVAFEDSAILEHPLFSKRMEAGTVKDMLNSGGILIGKGIADAMALRVGDSLTFISPQGHSTIAGMVPRMKAYKVEGIFKLGMHAYDSVLVVMPMDIAQQFFRLKSQGFYSVSQIDIMLANSNNAENVAASIAKNLRPDLRLDSWQTTNAGVFAALAIQRNVMVIILALIILVAAFNIVSSLVMLVKEKRGDIAILRTLGAPRSSILSIFMLAGSALGIIGSLVGVSFGMVLSNHIEDLRVLMEEITGQSLLPENIYFLSTLPTKIDPMQVISIVIVAIFLSLLATLYPALKAARMHPVEGLRHE